MSMKPVRDFSLHGDPDLSDDTFDRTTKVHDWRNHVPPVVKDHWKELAESERGLVALVAQHGADKEEWD